MGRKKGSKPVSAEKRQEWRKRHKQGEAIDQIALDEGADWKTVDKHIRLAISEEELSEERSRVLRDALRSHFTDLLGVVESMLDGVTAGRAIGFSGEKAFLEKALVKHIPRSAIWRLRKRWNSHLEQIEKLKEETQEKLHSELGDDSALATINQNNNGELFWGMLAALLFDLEEKIEGRSGLELKAGLKSDSQRDGIPVWESGSFTFGKLSEEDKEAVQSALLGMVSQTKSRDEYVTLKNLRNNLIDTGDKLKEELMILKWKRILPGRCHICPM